MNYCVKRTLISEALKEIAFWSEIEQEHMIVLAGVLGEAEEDTLKSFQELFIKQRDTAQGYAKQLSSQTNNVDKLLEDLVALTNQAQDLTGRLAGYFLELKQKYPQQAMLLDHMTLETKYYMKILARIGSVILA